LTNDYFQYYVDVSDRNQDEEARIKDGEIKLKDPTLANELKYVTTLKKYIVPVFNRHTKATFNVLVENFKGIYPTVSTDIIQKSIKLVDHEDETQKERRTFLFGIGIGLVIFAISIGVLLSNYENSRPAIIWTTVFALTSSLFGLAIYQIGRYIKRILTT
jgi:quinol-cytochrome oxidoreductase complex cytochrome b subunit